MLLTDELVKRALAITGGFEGATSPLAGVTGDFDGMGLSLGVLQWNIGTGSLQPLVRASGECAVLRAMPTIGGSFWRACNGDIKAALQTVRGWQASGRLRSGPRAELASFAGSAPFVAQQVEAGRAIARGAWNESFAWAQAWGRAQPMETEFFWFFDVHVQNGGMRGVTAQAVRDFIRACGQDKADDAICGWLAERSAAEHGYKDARRNAALWRNAVPAPRLPLFVASHLRASRSRLPFRADVMNRKGSIAVGRGWVHGRCVGIEKVAQPQAA